MKVPISLIVGMFAMAVFGFMGGIYAGVVTLDKKANSNAATLNDLLEARKKSRADTCKFIDAEHDRERARIIEGERQLYGDFREVFPNLTPRLKALAHHKNAKRYREVSETRPYYCPARKAPQPYPSLRALGGP